MANNELVAYLKSNTVFAELEPAHIDILASHATEKDFAAKEVLFRLQENAEHFYILRSGQVKVEIPAITGSPLVVQTLGADDVLGWSWLIPPYRWTFDAKAYEDSSLLVFDGRALLDVCEKDTAFGYALMKIFAGLMSQRLHAARVTMIETWTPPGW